MMTVIPLLAIGWKWN